MKAEELLNRAFSKILVQEDEAAFEPSEYQIALSALNTWMIGLDADGVNLGYTVITDLGDDITVPDGALFGMIPNLALHLASDFGGEISPALVAEAEAGLRIMEKIGMTLTPTEYLSTLPLGSGNQEWGANSRRFYPERESEIYTEANGSIGLEDDTEEEA